MSLACRLQAWLMLCEEATGAGSENSRDTTGSRTFPDLLFPSP